jgi:hypothetical protein
VHQGVDALQHIFEQETTSIAGGGQGASCPAFSISRNR